MPRGSRGEPLRSGQSSGPPGPCSRRCLAPRSRKMAEVPTITRSFWHAEIVALRACVGLSFES